MSFLHAFSGIYHAVRTEVHLRFHIVIANLICIFAVFYGLDRTGWAILLLTAFGVISAEIVNTAIEKAVDTATDEILPVAKFAKDASAGSVLIMAIGALLVGGCLFGDVERISVAICRIFTDYKVLLPCLFVGILDMLFLFFYKDNK